MSEDTIYEVIDLLKYSIQQKDWNSAEEALSLINESMGIESDLENSV